MQELHGPVREVVGTEDGRVERRIEAVNRRGRTMTVGVSVTPLTVGDAPPGVMLLIVEDGDGATA